MGIHPSAVGEERRPFGFGPQSRLLPEFTQRSSDEMSDSALTDSSCGENRRLKGVGVAVYGAWGGEDSNLGVVGADSNSNLNSAVDSVSGSEWVAGQTRINKSSTNGY